VSEKQKQVYEFIKQFMRLRGFTPSYAEIAQGLGMTSKSNIHRHVHALKERGLLKVHPHRCRSLMLIDNSVKTILSL